MLDPIVAIKVDSNRSEVLDTPINIEEQEPDDIPSNDVPARSEVFKATSSLEQDISRSTRTICQTSTYDPINGKAVEISAIQNCFGCLAELNNDESRTNVEIDN